MGDWRKHVGVWIFILALFAPLKGFAQGQSASAEPIDLGNPKTLELLPANPPPQITISPLETTPEAVPYEPTPLTQGLAVELIIDGSGSMKGLLGTETKIEIVKSIIDDLGAQWATLGEAEIELAVRIFGSKEEVDRNACEDSELLYPLTSIDPRILQKSLDGISARGSSPLSFALSQAAKDLKTSARDKVIVLLTDGGDTCQEDPCNTARNLYRDYRIITHVVGFDIRNEDENALRCIADNSNGKFLLARNKEELTGSLDEALRSTIPYNLRLKILVGGSPLPTTVTVFKAGTQKVIKKKKSFGIELFRLDTGSYDILVEYEDSVTKAKPSKVLRGVSLTKTGKVEQEVRFDLAPLTLVAINEKGKPAPTQYNLFKAGTNEKVASFQSSGEETTYFIEPGNYDIIANKIAEPGQEMTLAEKSVALTLEQGFSRNFIFQTGTVILKGNTSSGQAVSLRYKVTPQGRPEQTIAEGSVPAQGGKIEIPPGTYTIAVEGFSKKMAGRPKAVRENIAVEGGSVQETAFDLVVATLNLTAVKGGGNLASSRFTVIDEKDDSEVGNTEAKDGKASLTLSPGTYTVRAQLLSELYEEGPVTEKSNVTLTAEKPADIKLVYELGGVKLLGRNAKEKRLDTEFFVYEGGTENTVAKAGPLRGWVQFDLNPGNYDIKAVNVKGKEETIPTVWQRNIDIYAGDLVVREMVFTNAKLRLIGRGTNNEIIPVAFKVYQYGHDRPLLSGVTGQDWQSFDLLPDSYYIEASFVDLATSQTLIKWVSLKVEENAFVEKELRF